MNKAVNTYRVEIYGQSGLGLFGLRRDSSKIITFVDRSNEFQTSELLGLREIPLPNPKFFAIHAAIAGVLHTSGAGKFLDELLEKYGQDDLVGPVTW